MRIIQLHAEPDIVGRRVKIAWVIELDDGEGLAAIAPVALFRKTGDFEYGDAAERDAFLVYDGAAFPPAPIPGDLAVTDLDGWETREADERTFAEPVSVARFVPERGRFLEVLRCTVSTTYAADGKPLRRRTEILDNGPMPFSLQPGTTYYYQIFSGGIPTDADPSPFRSTATPGDAYALNRRLYDLLPAIYRRHDATRRPVTAGSDTVPEASVGSGQLRRFVDIFGEALDALRGSAENLRGLHDIDRVDGRMLPLLARWVGWGLSFDDAIPLHRAELKSAARLYRSVGTAPGIRAIATRYTGWDAQVAELGQHLARANQPARLNPYVSAEIGGGWRNPADASDALGFGPGNRESIGGPPAVLTGTLGEPFALAPDMRLALVVDDGLPRVLRLGADDFGDLTAAAAAEVAAVINAKVPGATAEVVAGGRLRLVSENSGPGSALRIEPSTAALVTLEAAPAGRLSPLLDPDGRLRVLYEAADLGDAVPEHGWHGRIRYKTRAQGRWRDSHEAMPGGANDQRGPTAAVLPNGQLWLAWTERPAATSPWGLRMALGTSAQPLPARLGGRRAGPFALIPGGTVAVVAGGVTEVFTVNAGDYLDPTRAQAAEVAAAMNAQLTEVSASVQPDGSIALETAAHGPAAVLRIDLAQSTTARTLGLAWTGKAEHGSWDETIEWTPDHRIRSVRPGRLAEPIAVADPAGGVRLFWSEHLGRRWRIAGAHWVRQLAVATSAGLALYGDGIWSVLDTGDGLPDDDIRALVLDADGALWLATAGGAGRRSPAGAWTTIGTGEGLASDDLRAVALAPDGLVWLGSDAGIDIYDPGDGTIVHLGVADGLAGNDVRQIVIARDGSLWVATATGASRRDADGSWESFDSGAALPSDDVRAAALADDGTLWLATAAGLARRDTAGGWSVVDTAAGLGSNDVRDVALAEDGTLWAATASGISGLTSQAVWVHHRAPGALASNDARALAPQGDGSLWVGTAAGISVLDPDGSWQRHDASGGLASNDVRRIQGPWSAVRELGATGRSNREPCAVVDEAGRTWLIWAQEQAPGAERSEWLLRQRVFEPGTGTWGAEQPVTGAAPGIAARDREPMALAVSGAGPRVFFSSNRGGGRNLWWLQLAGDGVPGPMTGLPPSPAIRRTPAPLAAGDGSVWLFHRSDENVCAGHLGTGASPQASPRGLALASEDLAEAATLRRYCGTTSIDGAHAERNALRRQWGDLLSFTPQKPAGPREPPLAPDELYTPGTIALYVRRGRLGRPLTRSNVDRLRQLLSELLPINLRAVVVLSPTAFVEYVYSDAYDLEDSHEDVYPNVDLYTGLADSAAAALPGWEVLRANAVGHLSADPLDLGTLRRRSYFPPPV